MLIILEGPDGSGSTTHAKLLTKALCKQGIDALQTWQPSTGPIGTDVRKILHKELPHPGHEAFQKMYSDDRQWHAKNVVIPALEAGKTVVCERWLWSTVIYARYFGIDEETALSWNQNLPEPDHHIVLLPTKQIMFERLLGKKQDIFENNEMQTQIYELYQEYSKRFNWPIVDTSGSISDGQQHLLQLLQL
jgi:dTMP kinase